MDYGTSNWLQHWHSCSRPLLRLLCLPYAGGGASLFRSWPQALPADVELCPVQLPGREERLGEPLFERMQPLLKALTNVVGSLGDLPLAIFGHSMGALIAFELARSLRRGFRSEPVHLFVSSHPAPQLSRKHVPIHRLPDTEFLQELAQRGGLTRSLAEDPELKRLILPTLRGDLALCETYLYSHDEPLDCAITVYGGLSDSEVNETELASWDEHTRGEFDLQLFPGGHFYLLEQRVALLRSMSNLLMPLMESEQQG